MYAAPRDPNYFMDYPLPPPLMDYHQPLPPPVPQFAMAEAIGKKSGAEVAPNCPRCVSSNTKFCYYNNYSFSQPRYFCKSCRRYWTKGGSLRSVPVGGGCRKSRRSRAARPSQYQRPGSASSDSDQTSSSDPEPSGGSGIDLAAVFANYLNPTSSAQAQTDTRIGSEPVFEELGEPSPLTDHPSFSDQQLGSSDQNIEFPGHDSGSYGLESMLNEDFMWPDEMNLAGLDWQPMVDLVEECGSLSSDEISANLNGDSWSMFDLSGCL